MKKILISIHLVIGLMSVFCISHGAEQMAAFNPPSEDSIPSGPLGASIKKDEILLLTPRHFYLRMLAMD